MTSYFSSHRNTKPIEDAPLSSLPEDESSALATLQARTKHVFSSPYTKLHPQDPWRTLSEREKNSLLVRFLRYNLLQIDTSYSHICKVAAWRAQECPWNLGAQELHGRPAGMPILSDIIRGYDDDVLLFIPCRHYEKSLVDRKAQATAIKAFFEYYTYATDGIRASSGVMLVDFACLQFRQVDLNALKNAINIFLSYYPEVLKKVILVNYPRWIHGTWKCIAPLLDARTIAKVVWVQNSDGLRSQLKKYFDPDSLPLWLEGNGKNGSMRLLSGMQMKPEECRAKLWS